MNLRYRDFAPPGYDGARALDAAPEHPSRGEPMRNLLRPHVLALVLLTGLVAAVAAGCGGGSDKASVPDNGVAVVGERTITTNQLNALIAQARRGYQTQKKAFPKAGTAAYRTLRDQAVTYLVQISELEQRASDLGVHVTKKQVDDYVAQV